MSEDRFDGTKNTTRADFLNALSFLNIKADECGDSIVAEQIEDAVYLCENHVNLLELKIAEQAQELADKWVNASVRLPEHDKEVLVWPRGELLHGVASYWRPTHPRHIRAGASHWWAFDEDGESYEVPVTHWRELPDGPNHLTGVNEEVNDD